MDNQTEVIEKIRKLMALAERGGTEAEAEVAMSKVQQLLAKHNLDIDAVRGKDEVTLVNECREYPWNQTWIRQAYMGIARLYFCKFYITQYGTKITKCYLIGEPVNVQTAHYIAGIIVDTGNRLAKRHASEQREEYVDAGGEPKDAVGHAISASNGFKKGFGLRINQRCNEIIRETTQVNVATPGTALVLADFYKKNELMLNGAAKTQFGLRLSTSPGMQMGAAGSMMAGKEAAEGVNLRAGGLGNPAGALRIGNK